MYYVLLCLLADLDIGITTAIPSLRRSDSSKLLLSLYSSDIILTPFTVRSLALLLTRSSRSIQLIRAPNIRHIKVGHIKDAHSLRFTIEFIYGFDGVTSCIYMDEYFSLIRKMKRIMSRNGISGYEERTISK